MKKLLGLFLSLSILLSIVPGFATEDTESTGETLSSLSEEELSNIYDTKNYENDFMPGEIIVGLNSQHLGTEDGVLFPELDIEKIEDVYEPLIDIFLESETLLYANDTNESAIDKLTSKIGTTYIITLSSKDDENVLAAINELKQNPSVAYVEPNYILEPEAITDDPEYNVLWGMEKVQAPQAWDIATGSNLVKIGVLDSGFDYTHPDLSDNLDMDLAYNATKQANIDMYDYISGHGTHVAGTIGAIGNNSVGITGVNWNVSIVPIKIALSDMYNCQ